MSDRESLRAAFDELRAAIERWQPELMSLFRPPVAFDADWCEAPGSEQLRELWSITGGQDRALEDTLGVVGGLCLLGPDTSQRERETWEELLTEGSGLTAVTGSDWGATSSQPDEVQAVYFAAGWIPVFSEPMEANYLAVDLVPGPAGRPGQIILCGRDEDEKCVVAPDLATVLRRLAAECRAGNWSLETGSSREGSYRYVDASGPLLSTLRP